MISAGEVGAIFRIVDEASPVLRRIMAELDRMEGVIKRVKGSLDSFRIPAGVNASIGNMSKQFDKVATAADLAVKGVDGSFKRIIAGADSAALGVEGAMGKMDVAIGATDARVVALGAALKGVSSSAAQLRGAVPHVAPPGLRSRGTGGGGGGGGGGGRGGGRGGHGLTVGAPVPLGPVHGHMSSQSDGFWELIGGMAIAEGVKHMLESNAEMQHLEAQAMATSTTSSRLGEIMKASWANAHANLNTTATQSMKYILELTQVTGSVDEALRLLPLYSQAKASLSSLKDEGFKEKAGGPSQLYGFARSLELLGVTQDPAKLQSTSAAMLQEMIGMKGLVDGNMLFQGIQNAGGARYAWGTDFIQHVLGPLLQASPRAGAGLYQLDRSFGSGVSTLAMAHGAEKYGFWDKSDEIYDDAAHKRFKGMRTGSIAGYDMMRSNPEEWALKVALPLLQAHGVNIDDTNEMTKAVQEISRGNKNLGVILDELLLPGTRGQLAKERANIDAVDKDAVGILQANDPMLKIQAFKAKWDDLMNSLGGPLMGNAMAMLDRMTAGLDTMAQFFAAHPTIANLTSDAIIAAGGLLILSGAISILKFATSGLSIFGLLGGAGHTGTPGAPGGTGGSLLGGFMSTVLPVALVKTYEDQISGFMKDGLTKLFGGPPSGAPVAPHGIAEDWEAVKKSWGDMWPAGRPQTGTGPRIPGFGQRAPNMYDAPNIYSSPAGPQNVNATLQAAVSTSITNITQLDGHAIAQAIMPLITQMITSAMHSAVAGALEGATNDVAHRMAPGMHN